MPKISELPVQEPFDGSELLAIVQSDTSKQGVISSIRSYLLGLANIWTATQTFSTVQATSVVSDTVQTGLLNVDNYINVPVWTVATAPGAATAGQGATIYLTDGNAGAPCLAVSNGVAWKVVATGATIASGPPAFAASADIGTYAMTGTAMLPVKGDAAGFDGPAELPRLEPTVTGVPTVTGTTFTVNSGQNLQTAINSAAAANGNLTHEIVIQAGATFTGAYTLPNKTGTNPTGSGWIILRSSALASLPAAGTRVLPANASNMAKLQPSGTLRALQGNAGAHHYYFVGLEITYPGTTASIGNDFIRFGVTTETVAANVSHHFTVDRCYIHGHSTLLSTRGIQVSANHFICVDSYFDDIHHTDAATDGGTCISGACCQGPWLVRNNYFGASGKGWLVGGADPPISGMVPSDLTFRGNHHRKLDAWYTAGYASENFFEQKMGIRVLIENCVFYHHYEASAGQLRCFNLKSENQTGTANWTQTGDITVRYNIFHRAPQFGVLSPTAGANIAVNMQKVSMHNNLVYDIGVALSGNSGIMWSLNRRLDNVSIRNNTFVHNFTGTGSALAKMDLISDPQGANFVFKDNIGILAADGFDATGAAAGTASLALMWSSYTFTGNLLVGSGTGYPAGNTFVANLAAVGFTDEANDDYSLTVGSPARTSSTTGGISGADIPTVLTRTAGVESP